MREQSLSNIGDLYNLFEKYRTSSRYKFRGQSIATWKLIPKAGRLPFSKINDQELFRQWKRRAKSFISQDINQEIALLAIAQHTGVPTRLLDWTHNPLVAVFFACIENENEDGALFVYKPDKFTLPEQIKNPFDSNQSGINFIQPDGSSNRLINQFGYFSIHNGPMIEMDTNNSNNSLEKIIIPNKLKKELIHMLNQFGISYLTLFPDLEGLAKYLNWFYENYEYWDKKI